MRITQPMQIDLITLDPSECITVETCESEQITIVSSGNHSIYTTVIVKAQGEEDHHHTLFIKDGEITTEAPDEG